MLIIFILYQYHLFIIIVIKQQLQKYKAENDRLRAENRALTRVVSKLTISAQSQLQNKK